MLSRLIAAARRRRARNKPVVARPSETDSFDADLRKAMDTLPPGILLWLLF